MARPAISPAANRTRAGARAWAGSILPLIAIYAFLLAVTRPTYIGDTYWYVLDIGRALGQGWPHSEKIWNFAHLLLRPAGLLLSSAFLGAVAPWFGGSRDAGIAFLLIALSVAATLICALLVRNMTLRLTRSGGAALVAASAFLCASVVLNYSRSGASYLPGLAFSLGALYVAGFSQERRRRRASCSGALAAISVLFWLPYVASFPAILAAGPILNPGREKWREHLRFAVEFAAAAGAVLLAGFGAGAAAVHVHDVHSLLAWVRSSDTQFRDRKLMRMVTGFARSFYELGNMAVYLKWYLFKDPYARVGLLETLRLSLPKLALFYVSLGGLAVLLWISRAGRALLLLAVVAALPHIGMALAFESGSPERYLAALPLFFVGFGYAMANPAFRPRTRLAAAVLCCAHIPLNLAALAAPVVNAAVEKDAARISALSSLNPASRMYVINGLDGLFVFRQGYPFHPLNRWPLPEIVSVLPLGPRVPMWRGDFACGALAAWNGGGQVWISRRLVAERPLRQWLWVEGDDRRIHWADFRSFFSRLERGLGTGGADGFFLVPDDAAMRAALLAEVPGGDARNCPAAPR